MISSTRSRAVGQWILGPHFSRSVPVGSVLDIIIASLPRPSELIPAAHVIYIVNESNGAANCANNVVALHFDKVMDILWL